MLRAGLLVVLLGCVSTVRPVKATASANAVAPGEQARLASGERWTDLIVTGDRRRAHAACERLVAAELERLAPTARVERACEQTALPPRDREVMLVERSDGREFVSAFDRRIAPDVIASREETVPFDSIVQCARVLRQLTDAERTSLRQATRERLLGALEQELEDAGRVRDRECATNDDHDCDQRD